MCGLVGILNFGEVSNEVEKIRRETSIFLATEILQQTQTRGKDATGVVNLHSNGSWYGIKEGIECMDFISNWKGTEKDFAGFLKVWRKKKTPHKAFIGHCRKSSVGNTWDNINNHPIIVDEIVGVHNGTLDNHEKIFKKLKGKRDGEVDSEAIMRMLNVYSRNGTEPFTVDMVNEVAIRLQGSYSVLAFSGNNPFQIVSFRDGRPMEFALIRPTKQIIIASEKKFLQTAFFRMNKEVKLYGNNIYPYLTDKDVDFKMLIDDSIAIWDLTREIEKNTFITDLYEGKDIPRTNRLWRIVKSSYYGTGSGNFNNKNKNTTVKKDEKKTANSTGSTGSTNTSVNSSNSTVIAEAKKLGKTVKKLGMVWDKDLESFKPSTFEINKSEKLGNVEIDIDDGQITPIKDEIDTDTNKDVKTNTDIDFADGNDDIQDVITDPVKINEIAIEEIKNVTIADSDDDDSNVEDDNDNAEDIITLGSEDIELLSTEKADKTNINLHPEALENANLAANSLIKYENQEDVMTDIDISDTNTMGRLSLHAIANRIKKITYKLGFYDGWMAHKSNKGTKTPNLDKEKTKKAEKNIRILKTMSNIIFKIWGKKTLADNKIIHEAVMESLRNGDQISSDDIDRIYSQGDMNDSLGLRKIRAVVKEKEK